MSELSKKILDGKGDPMRSLFDLEALAHEVEALDALRTERDAALSQVARLREAARAAQGALDEALGDTDLDEDESPLYLAHRTLIDALAETEPKGA